jgi:hypothetical protein
MDSLPLHNTLRLLPTANPPTHHSQDMRLHQPVNIRNIRANNRFS